MALLNLKTVGEVCSKDMTYLIDSYQRPYKWTPQQVEDLLNDIYGFDKQTSSFYCLQPLVVKKLEENKYEVIDGQQRLTTVYLILTVLTALGSGEKHQQEYTTRKVSGTFLKELTNEMDLKENWEEFVEDNAEFDKIDIYHFYVAFKTIKDWLGKDDVDKEKLFLEKLLEHTQFIWYEDNSTRTSEQLFSSINSGKIALTNSEIMKADLLFTLSNDEQVSFAQKWFEIEKQLNEDEFWFFIQSNSTVLYQTRIDYIFEIVLQHNKSCEKHNRELLDKYFSINENRIEHIWNKVLEIYNYILEWFLDNEMYHKIGYLINFTKHRSISSFVDEYLNKSKSKEEFNQWVSKIIVVDFQSEKDGNIKYEFEDWNFFEKSEKQKQKQKQKQLLLLLNTELYRKSTDQQRFPFYRYWQMNNKRKWSLEHVFAKSSKDFSDDELKKSWLKSLDKSVMSEEQKAMLNSLVECEITAESENEFREKFREFLDEFNSSEKVNNIYNLCLLDKTTNSELGAKPFYEKRKVLINKIDNSSDIFIPIATKKLFNKEFIYEKDNATSGIKQVWGDVDRMAYEQLIKNTLANI